MDKTILSIILALFIIGMIAFSGARIRIHRIKSLACMMTVVCLMSGCDKKGTEPDLSDVVYDKWSYRPVCEDFSVVRDETGTACVLYKGNDKPEPIIRDCFTDASDFTLAVMTFIDGDTIYYLNQYKTYSYEIIALDTNDFSEHSVHKVEWSDNVEEMDMLFGLGYYLPKKMQKDETVDRTATCKDGRC